MFYFLPSCCTLYHQCQYEIAHSHVMERTSVFPVNEGSIDFNRLLSATEIIYDILSESRILTRHIIRQIDATQCLEPGHDLRYHSHR